MKYAISFFGVLIASISVMLFFQYQVYSDKLESGDGDFSYTQEIDITYRNGNLDVRHHFHNLPSGTINIQWPNLAVSPDCFIDSANSCDRLSEDKTKFEAGDGHHQSLSYIIPLEGNLTTQQFLKDIFVNLSNGEATYSTVHISTDNHIKGSWVTGLPLIGQQSLTLVNYSMFSGTGGVNEIYWQIGDMNVQQPSEQFSLYSSSPLSSNVVEELKSSKLLSDEHIAIVHGENFSRQQGERILFLKDLSVENVLQNILLFQVGKNYQLDGSPQWLREVVASFLTGSTMGGVKAKEIVNTLTSNMSDTQLTNWVEKLKSLKGDKISSAILDKELSTIFDLHTKYFSMNENTEEVYPLLFHDRRKIYLNSELLADGDLVYKDGMLLYSADAVLKRIRFKTSVGKNGYYVENESKRYRFPQNYGFYVYNEQRYNTTSEPMTIIAGKHYIEEKWLQKLFDMEITKNNTTIMLNSDSN